MKKLNPDISPDIYNIAEGFKALSIHVTIDELLNNEVSKNILNNACSAVLRGEPNWADSHLLAWNNIFKKFGAKPNRTPCSADALRKRVLRDGMIQSIDPIVDIYNAVSLQYAVPIGGESVSSYVGNPRLELSKGNEPFDTLKSGDEVIEYPSVGEVIWRDDLGVTCRRWNWRQGNRTRINTECKSMWFILESLPEMPIDKLYEAGDMFIDSFKLIAKNVNFLIDEI